MRQEQHLVIGPDLARRIRRLAKYSGMTIKSWTTRVLDGVVQEHEQKIKGELAKQP